MNCKQFVLSVALLSPLYAYAADTWVYDESTCVALPATWDGSTNTCTLDGDFTGGITLNSSYGNITLDGAGHTITLSGSERVLLTGANPPSLNNVTIIGDTTSGVLINRANYASVSNVSISGPFDTGIDVRGSSNVSIMDSSVSGAGSAAVAFAFGSTSATVINNTLTGTKSGDQGIYYNEYLPSNNAITGNTISNFSVGVGDYFNSGNTIYQNNFLTNDTHVFAPTGVTLNLPAPDGGNYYDTFDEPGEGCVDGNSDGFCDAAFTASGGATDNLPWAEQDGWVSTADAEGTVTTADGGTVTTDDGSVVIDVEADSVTEDTTITVVLEEIDSPDIIVGTNVVPDTALALYTFGPDGTTFDPSALLTLKIDVTALTEMQRSLISIYRHEDTNGDGSIDSSDGFVVMDGASCTSSEEPTGSGTFIATCTAPIDHFSAYAIILLNDSDEDGVADSVDACPSENALGFDVDSDGCIDSFAGLSELTNVLVEEGSISTTMRNSLLAKTDAAAQSATKDNLCASINQLEALKNQISAQVDKKVSLEAAETVTGYADSIIIYLSSLLDSGVTCSE